MDLEERADAEWEWEHAQERRGRRDMRHGDEITVDGRQWRVIGIGSTVGECTYVHLASGAVRQKNGSRPLQCCGWLRNGALLDAP